MLLLLFTSSPVMYVCLSVGGCVHVSTTPGEGRGVTSELRIELSSSGARS